MKIKFVQGHKPKGHAADIPDYKAGETYDFSGPVAEGYARKYIERGYAAEVVDEPAPVIAEIAPAVEVVPPADVEAPQEVVSFRPKPPKYRR